VARAFEFQRTDTAVPVSAVERVFLVFSLAVTAVQCVVYLPPLRTLWEVITPYAGWVFGMPYMTAAFMWPSIYNRPVRTVQTLRVTLSIQTLILLIYAAYGVSDYLMFRHLLDDPSPMLRYSPVRPIWTVVIPMIWAVALWRARPAAREKEP
jgi:hypothetical protein